MSTWFNSVDIYCERLDPSFWAEPINAISNLSFIVAGFFIWRLRSPHSALMATLMILIGLGSFSFHTFANRLTGLLDVVAIALYLVAFAFLIPKQWSRSSLLIQMGSVLLLIVSIVLAHLLMSHLKLDIPLCDSIGGSHWLWHLLNGLTLYWSCYSLCTERHSKSQ